MKDLRYQYPLEEHVKENSAEDARCLAMAEEVIEASQARWPLFIMEKIGEMGEDNDDVDDCNKVIFMMRISLE